MSRAAQAVAVHVAEKHIRPRRLERRMDDEERTLGAPPAIEPIEPIEPEPEPATETAAAGGEATMAKRKYTKKKNVTAGSGKKKATKTKAKAATRQASTAPPPTDRKSIPWTTVFSFKKRPADLESKLPGARFAAVLDAIEKIGSGTAKQVGAAITDYNRKGDRERLAGVTLRALLAIGAVSIAAAE